MIRPEDEFNAWLHGKVRVVDEYGRTGTARPESPNWDIRWDSGAIDDSESEI